MTIDRRQGARGRRRAGRDARPHDRGDRGGDHPDRGLRHVFGRQRLVSRFGVDPREFSLPRLRRRRPDDGLLPGARARHARGRRADRRRACCRALGGLIADLKSDFIKTLYVDLDAAAAAVIRSEFADPEGERARLAAATTRAMPGRTALIYSAEMRYRGQSFELDTPLDRGGDRGGRHRRDGGGLPRRARARLRPCRPAARRAGDLAAPRHQRQDREAGVPAPALLSPARPTPIRQRRGLARRRAAHSIAVYRRADLVPGQTFAGPAVVTQDDCTTVVPPGLTVARRRLRQSAHRCGRPRHEARQDHAAGPRQLLRGRRREHGLDADAHRPFDLRQGDRGFLLPGADARRA